MKFWCKMVACGGDGVCGSNDGGQWWGGQLKYVDDDDKNRKKYNCYSIFYSSNKIKINLRFYFYL